MCSIGESIYMYLSKNQIMQKLGFRNFLTILFVERNTCCKMHQAMRLPQFRGVVFVWSAQGAAIASSHGANDENTNQMRQQSPWNSSWLPRKATTNSGVNHVSKRLSMFIARFDASHVFPPLLNISFFRHFK